MNRWLILATLVVLSLQVVLCEEPVNHIQVCPTGRRCHFKASVLLQARESDATQSRHALKFIVAHESGSGNDLVYRLHVKDVNSAKAQPHQVTKAPCFFVQNCKTGAVSGVFFSTSETPAGRQLKHGLIRELTKVHHESEPMVALEEDNWMLSDLDLGVDEEQLPEYVKEAQPTSFRLQDPETEAAVEGVVEAGSELAGTVKSEGRRIRDTAASEEKMTSDSTREEDTDARHTVRSADRRTVAEAQADGEKGRAEIRATATFGRRVQRKAGRQAIEADQESAAQTRRVTRRAERRTESSVKTNRRAARSEMAMLGNEMHTFDELNQEHRDRKLARREAGLTKEEDERLMQQQRREQERKTYSELDKADEEEAKDIKNLIKSEEDEDTERKRFQRMDDETRQEFGEVETKKEFSGLTDSMRRHADVEADERRRVGQVEDKLRREDKDDAERRRLNRIEETAEKTAARTEEEAKKFKDIEADVARSRRRDRRQSRRAAQEIKSKEVRAGEKAATRRGAQSIRDEERREGDAALEREQAAATEKELRAGSAQERRIVRKNTAREIAAQERVDKNEEAGEVEAATRGVVRDSARDVRETAREAAADTQETLAEEQENRADARHTAEMDAKLARAEHEASRGARSVERTTTKTTDSNIKELRGEAETAARAQRATDAEVLEAQRKTNDRMTAALDEQNKRARFEFDERERTRQERP